MTHNTVKHNNAETYLRSKFIRRAPPNILSKVYSVLFPSLFVPET